MLLHPDIWEFIQHGPDDTAHHDRMGRFQADLEAFVSEREIYPKYLKCLYPRHRGVWAIRSVEDKPSLRLLGRFAMRDAFVALALEDRISLGAFESQQWRQAKRDCVQRWNALFPNFPPLKGETADDFLSGSVNAEYFRD